MRSSCSFNDVNWSPPTAAPPPPFHCVRLPARPFLFFVRQMNLLHSQNQKEKKYLWNMVWKWFADFSFLLLWLPQLWGFFFFAFCRWPHCICNHIHPFVFLGFFFYKYINIYIVVYWYTRKGTSSGFTPACLSGNRLCASCACGRFFYAGVFVLHACAELLIRPYPPLPHHSTPLSLLFVARSSS